VGLIVAVVVVTATRSFDLDRFFVPKELVLHATALLAGLLTLARVRHLRVTWTDLALVGVIGISALSAVWAANPWAAGRALALTCSGAAVFWVARVLRQEGLDSPLVRSAAIAVVLAAVLALAQAYGIESPYFSTNRAPGGTLGNRNFVGHLAAFGLPLLLVPALRSPRWSTVLLSMVGLLLVVGILVLTRSRAAWLGAGAVVVVLGLCVLVAPTLRRWSMLLRAGLVVAVIAAGGGLATSLPNALDWVSDSPYLESAQGMLNYREGSGQGRLLQYQRSLGLVQQAPLLGVGPGNWSVAYPGVAPPGDPSMSGSRPGMTSNPWPSSDAVALVSERGLLGVLVWLLFAGSLLWTVWASLRKEGDDRVAAGAGLLLAMSAGVVVTGAFDAVLLLAWPVLLVATVAGALLPEAQARSIAVPRWLRVAFFAVLVTLAGVGAVRSGGQWAAMRLYEADASRASLERAAQLDPGSYRVHLRLAQRTRGTARCPHAQTAAALYPHATAAQRLAARCE
ncbi:MAG: O-antigen ligase family protein, partial [Bacteroidota bacterium]